MEQTGNASEVSRISKGTIIKGEITTENDIRIDGTFEGTVRSKGKVVAGESANIKGDIYCNNSEFWGHIDGDFYVKDTLALKSTAVVVGNLNVRRLQVDLNATFNGTCKMLAETDYKNANAEPQK